MNSNKELTPEEEFLQTKLRYTHDNKDWNVRSVTPEMIEKWLKEYAAKAVEEDQKQCICREL